MREVSFDLKKNFVSAVVCFFDVFIILSLLDFNFEISYK
jgi:hypothetical protein